METNVQLSQVVNSLLVWQGLVDKYASKGKWQDVDFAMKTFNGYADEAAKLGVTVIKYIKYEAK